MENCNDKKSLRSIAEAHLYVAILKADNKISGRELLEASNLARHSQSTLNILNMNKYIEETISNHIKNIARDEAYESWNWSVHLENALSILRKLRDDGDWSVKLTAAKIEDSLRKLSFVDGYDVHELQIVEKILTELKALSNT